MTERITVRLEPETPGERARLLSLMQAEQNKAAPEPLPIWFFVGLILLVYGIIVTASGVFMAPRATVLAETRPAVWWGGIMCVGGATFLAIGLKGRRGKP